MGEKEKSSFSFDGRKMFDGTRDGGNIQRGSGDGSFEESGENI